MTVLRYATIPATQFRADVGRNLADLFAARSSSNTPLADAREDATGFSVDLDLPGVTADVIEIVAEDGVLTVRGVRPARDAREGEAQLFNERVSGAFSRALRVPKNADLESISATFENGVLSIRIAKVAPVQPKKVTIQVPTATA